MNGKTMSKNKIAILAAAGLVAAAFISDTASAKSRSGGNGGASNSSTAQVNAGVPKPLKFKLIRCHKYTRIAPDGTDHSATVCS
jgi:hypothetical protein